MAESEAETAPVEKDEDALFSSDLPKWRSHEHVYAARITSVDLLPTGVIGNPPAYRVSLAGDFERSITVAEGDVTPAAGQYWVEQEGSDPEFVDADVFEKGYSTI